MLGCVEGRSSTHELEHIVPEHWPTSLVDAADKIDTRLIAIESLSSSADTTRVELVEIISWLPEVAADTALREADWSSIHQACRAIETLMQKPDDFRRIAEELRKLNARLRELDSLATAGQLVLVGNLTLSSYLA